MSQGLLCLTEILGQIKQLEIKNILSCLVTFLKSFYVKLAWLANPNNNNRARTGCGETSLREVKKIFHFANEYLLSGCGVDTRAPCSYLNCHLKLNVFFFNAEYEHAAVAGRKDLLPFAAVQRAVHARKTHKWPWWSSGKGNANVGHVV